MKETKETVYLAYVNDVEPGALLYGQLLREGDRPLLFAEPTVAFMNAQILKQMDIDAVTR